MKLSTKGRYAMVALADIAMQPDGDLVTLSSLSPGQDVSRPSLSPRVVKLRPPFLFSALPGPGSGSPLGRPA
ncbi:Rrf2 family transcriptional regulator, partial [Salipiger sp. HF18]|uniref:Rrf2 family transcriptional regulator n=1 Tax=Salipiger sp. HF18 TaxID=2721557 RepID=UPI00158862CA|nr:Rrf2 family transcriptional regulator [Salipiger sp. HF18]